VGVVKAPVFAAVALVALALGFVGSDSSGSNEARPRAVAADCQTVRLPVVVLLDAKDHRHLIAHTHEALELGEPRILHIDRADADRHRAESLRGVPSRAGFDRDEYPPAVAREGGTGADVELVPAAENRSGGAVMGSRLRGFCDGQAFVLEP
jgi:hypothetical protein